jgi:hypothetical protein
MGFGQYTIGMATHMRRLPWLLGAVVCGVVASLSAQAPAPAARAQQPPPAPRPGVTVPTAATPAAQPAQNDGRPSEAELGFPVYPSAVYLRSYDAGRGQKYYIFGSTVPFAEMVAYYRNVLKEKGNLVFEVPPTHVFEVGRYREETMAFPPSVTVKDYTFSGSAGYPNPKAGTTPERFPTLVQIVPAPAGSPQ